jgi:hypothetical protein
MKNTLKRPSVNRIVQPDSKNIQQQLPIQPQQPFYQLQPPQIALLHKINEQAGTPLQYIHDSMWCLVVKKRNITLETLNHPDLLKNDIYHILSFHTTNKGASIAFVNFRPVNTPEWRVIEKYIIKIPYNNVNFNIESCPTFANEIINY